MDYNPHLKPWRSVQSVAEAGQGQIEYAGDVANLVWQTRSVPPNEYASQLCNALETLFLSGVDDLSGIVTGLNQAGLKNNHPA